MATLNLQRLGQRLTGWDKKGGKAAEYKLASSDHHYRTHKPEVAPTASGGLHVSIKLDHMRDLAQEDHATVELTLNPAGEVGSWRAWLVLQGSPEFDTGLVTAAAAFRGSEHAAIGKVAAKVLDSLSNEVDRRGGSGGRAAFPMVVRQNLLHIASCVEHGEAGSLQGGWRRCNGCQCLHFGGVPGACPAGGSHTADGTRAYAVHHFAPGAKRQNGWRWCHRCQVLFFAEGGAAGACAAGTAGTDHSAEGSGEYSVPHNDSPDRGQEGWRWCKKCQCLHFAGASPLGACPAGGPHAAEGSGRYHVPP